MEAINLLEKRYVEDYRNGFNKMRREKPHEYKDSNGRFNTGDVVHFMGGFHDNIEYISEILGFDVETGKAYMLWDCWWFSIDMEKRFVKFRDIVVPHEKVFNVKSLMVMPYNAMIVNSRKYLKDCDKESHDTINAFEISSVLAIVTGMTKEDVLADIINETKQKEFRELIEAITPNLGDDFGHSENTGKYAKIILPLPDTAHLKNGDFTKYYDTKLKRNYWVLGYFGGSVNIANAMLLAEEYSILNQVDLKEVVIDEILSSRRYKGFKIIYSNENNQNQTPEKGADIRENVWAVLTD